MPRDDANSQSNERRVKKWFMEDLPEPTTGPGTNGVARCSKREEARPLPNLCADGGQIRLCRKMG